MDRPRPAFINLFQIRFPAAAWMSVAHRASGVLMVFAIPFLVYLLDVSLHSEQGFQHARDLLDSWFVQLLLLWLGWGLLHHLFAGIRYLFLDFDKGVERETARVTAWLVMISAVVVVIAFAGWIFL